MSNTKEVVVKLTEAQNVALLAKVAQFARERGLTPDRAVTIGIAQLKGEDTLCLFFDVEIGLDGTGAE